MASQQAPPVSTIRVVGFDQTSYHAGDEVTAFIEINAVDDVLGAGIECEFKCLEVARVAYFKMMNTEETNFAFDRRSHTWFSQKLELSDRNFANGIIPKGKHIYQISFDIPETSPGSFNEYLMTWSGINRGAIVYELDLFVKYKAGATDRIQTYAVSQTKLSEMQKDENFMHTGVVPVSSVDGGSGGIALFGGAPSAQANFRARAQHQYNRTQEAEDHGPTAALFGFFSKESRVRTMESRVFEERVLIHSCTCPVVVENVPTNNKLTTSNLYKNVSMIFGDQGEIEASITLDKHSYFPGETINFSVSVRNGTPTPLGFRCRFFHVITLAAIHKRREEPILIESFPLGDLEVNASYGYGAEPLRCQLHVPDRFASPTHRGIVASSEYKIVIEAASTPFSTAEVLTAFPTVRVSEMPIVAPPEVNVYGYEIGGSTNIKMYSLLEVEIPSVRIGINLVPNYAPSVQAASPSKSSAIEDPRPRVVSVDESSAAWHAAMHPGDIILKVNGYSVESVAEFSETVRRVTRRPLVLTVLRTILVPEDRGLLAGTLFNQARHYSNGVVRRKAAIEGKDKVASPRTPGLETSLFGMNFPAPEEENPIPAPSTPRNAPPPAAKKSITPSKSLRKQLSSQLSGRIIFDDVME